MSSKGESKITARIDPKVYAHVKDHFHHGQQTQFFRQIFDSVQVLINDARFSEVTDYLYNGHALVLPGKVEEVKEVTED